MSFMKQARHASSSREEGSSRPLGVATNDNNENTLFSFLGSHRIKPVLLHIALSKHKLTYVRRNFCGDADGVRQRLHFQC